MLIGFFLAMLITLPAMAAMRYVLTRRVSALMKRRSPSAEAAATLDRGQEVPAGTTPQIELLDSESDAARSDAARRSEAAEGGRLFLRWWVLEMAGAGLVFALAAIAMLGYPDAQFVDLFAYRGGGSYAVSSSQVEYFIFESGVGLDVGAYMLLVTLRFVFYRRFYTGGGIRAARKVGFLRRWVTMLFEEIFRAVLHPRHAWFPFVMYAGFVLSFDKDYLHHAVFNAVLAGLAIHFGLRVWLARRAQAGVNRRLLILRVFGRNESSVLTFGALRGFWSYVGSSFTVVDRSYLAFRYRGHSEDHVSTVFFCMSFFFLLSALSGRPLPTLEEGAGVGVIAGLIVIVGNAVYLTTLYFGAPRYFASDRAHIRKMVGRVLRRPRRFWPLTFRNLDMHCYDNTWREAVAEFVEVADVVLMDLRGYSEARRGCEYEVDFLFDSIRVERIVFLVDNDNSLELVETLVLRRWEQLSVRSPNLGHGAPQVTIYRSDDGRANDMRGLINVLAARVEQGAEAAGSTALAA